MMKELCLFLLVSSGVNGWLWTNFDFKNIISNDRYKTEPCIETYSYMSTCSRETRYKVDCSAWSWGWRECTRYKLVDEPCVKFSERCCSGYTGNECNYAICGGGHGQSACNRYEGRQIYQTHVVTNSGGFCKRPMECVDCNYGYYSSEGYCKECRQIENCNLKNNCTEYSQTLCDKCDGELRKEERGFNAFTSLPDNRQCQRTCSWRDGYRCFPGKCPTTTHMLFPQDCECARGFGGPNCATANKGSLPSINVQSMELASDVKLFLEIPNANVKNWTNKNNWKSVTIIVKASYVPSFSASDKPPYINTYTIGMDQIVVSATLTRRASSSSWQINKNCLLEANCIVNESKDIHTTSPWKYILQGAFQHQDEITFRVDAKNGGFVEYNDRELDRNLTYSITGITNTSILVLGFDMEAPQHCYEMKSPSACSGVPLQAKDFNTDKYITVSWDDWHDPDSGLYHIVFNLYLLEAKDHSNPALDYKLLLPEVKMEYTETVKSKVLEFGEPGPYSIELIMYDLAGNYKVTRRIVMFDDNSTVDLQGVPIKVMEATDTLWINRYTESLELNWKGRFINQRHFLNSWLAEVKDGNVSRYLEDTKTDSARNIDPIKNINGTVRFDICYIEELDGQIRLFDFTSATTTEFDEQRRFFRDVQLTDGKRLTYKVRGYDCMGKFAEDSVTVMIDLSPPVIRNLWLTKGNVLNISVHSVTELQNVTIEWEVYDTHSGIHTVLWKLFDNFTGIELLHGQSYERPQGETKTLQECEEKYRNYSRGHNCYCTPYSGCYHRHYQIKPQVTITGNDGLHSGKEIGVHDYDYFIEVTVLNNAGLQTIQAHKITIDTSPPHDGTVHEGIPGQPEVDFQQFFNIHVYWDDFFDKESGVWFYMYGFAKGCLSAEDLDIHSANHKNVFKTYESVASFTVPEQGKYYTTVMAYNHALDHSNPVCSDGLTIDFVATQISEVVVKGAITAKGLIQDELTNEIYVLHENREIEHLQNPAADCIPKVSRVSAGLISVLPRRRLQNGTESRIANIQSCSTFINIHSSLSAFITTTGYLELSWNSSGNVHDYEVGLSSQDSDIPDLMNFQSSHHHRHIRLYHPNIFNGDMFYLVINAVTRSSVVSITVVGPFSVDSTSPDFSGDILVNAERTQHNGTYLIARWETGSFEDHGDPNPLIYEVAIGTSKGGKDVLTFQPLTAGGSCTISAPPTCTAIPTTELPWHLHGQHVYFVSVKAKNTVGLFVVASSDEYFHNVERTTEGVVFDINGDSDLKFVDIDDIDFQTRKDQLTARWSGFSHPHEDISFYVCLAKQPKEPYITCSDEIHDKERYTFSVLNLDVYETYYQIVIAETEAGNTTAVSDGVTIVVENDEIQDIYVYDGPICNNTENSDLKVNTSHHSMDKRLTCTNDVDYQMSSSRLQAHWYIPEDKQHYLKDIYWAIEERAPIADVWSLYRPYERVRTFLPYMDKSGLHFSSGIKYRVLLKFCANQYCFKATHSDGFICTPNPPIVGKLLIEYDENKLAVKAFTELFRDSDIEDIDQSRDVMDHYEWALVDSAQSDGLLTKWEKVTPEKAENLDELIFFVPLKNKITFTKCWKLSVRGYTKAGSSAEVSAEIRNCSELQQVKPAVVIDATGKSASEENKHIGNPIVLEENENWKQTDVDFTPYDNIISAVWPLLRHKNYIWAILKVSQEDPTIFYEDPTYLNLREPCSHPDALKCGNTTREYINVEFEPGELIHGIRYIVCIHANTTILEHEFWKQELAEVNACSDGVTVDLTPPVPADVWIGYDKNFLYQTSTSELTVNWNSFIDVEEGGNIAHSSGIAGYEVAIGTFKGGRDVKPFTRVGLVNHKTFHQLSLQSGHTYFATVKAADFTGQTTESISEGVKLDISPPVLTTSVIHINSRHVYDTSFVDACWHGVFVDDESGISHYSWAVGTKKGYDDMMPYIDTAEECGITPMELPLTLKEGHAYFVNVKGYNKAGLYSMASSWAFIVDASPPVPGVVCDGPRHPMKSCNDDDYIDKSSVLNVHWTGFFEPHSTIKEYYINVGSCRDCEDVLNKQPIGIRTEIELTWLHLAQGGHYFVTITACNTADMCSSSTSDGIVVDSSPPVPGVVIDGTEDSDIQYQASKNHIGCKWYGFNDPESGISHYIWRVGTTKGGDDILTATDVHKAEEAFVFDLQSEIGKQLNVKVKIYCTVRAYNNAGKYVESFSNGFIVDDTPPEFISPMTLAPIGSIVQGTSVLRSTLKVLWKVKDEESFIETQFLSISSHVGGDFNLSSTKVDGISSDYTFTGLDFHDGSFYDVKLVTCNGAKVCSNSKLTNILVDSTPPTPGTFAVNTDHAANLARQPEDWMTWTSISINLAWLGFEDVHTGIDRYIVNIGSTYMNNDLNEVAYTLMIVNHGTDVSYLEDGFVQTHTFRTQSLTKYKSVYVTIRAINKVGLSSDIVHSQFNLLSGGTMGIMDLVRRCDSHSCLGHCVCAAHGQLCIDRSTCNETTGSTNPNPNTLIEVKDFIDLSFPTNKPAPLHTPDNTLLAAKWYITQERGLRPQWFEWSVGESSQELPTGVFDEIEKRVWHDSGKEQQWIFTHKRGKVLEDHEKYSFFVRAWYDENTFAIFKSPGVVIYSTPPLTTTLRGKAVKEVLVGQTKDIDFFQRDTQVNADWTGKFLNTYDSLSHFHVYISSLPGGHDTHIVAKDLTPTVTSVNITGLNYVENTKYFTVVQAYNLAGLHTTESSDGFMLDLQPPSTGIIQHGYGISNMQAINKSNGILFRWHGFSDAESGIKSYRYCVFLDLADCISETMTYAGIATHAEYYAPESFPQGSRVKAGVQAIDAAGHISDMVISNGVIIDTTPPVRVKTIQCLNNIISDPSFEDAVYNGTQCYISNTSWTVLDKSCVRIERSSEAQDGSSIMHLQGSISQTLDVDNVGKYRITFFTSAIPSDNLHLSTTEGYVEVKNERYLFLMYNKQNPKSYAWQKHTFYFHLTSNVTRVLLGTINTLGTFALDNVKLERCVGTSDEQQNDTNHVAAHTIFVHDWSSLHAEWVFTESETEIVDYTWAIGTVRGGTQLQDFTSVGKRTFCNINSLRMEHNTNVFVTVVAENAAGLRAISYSDPVMIDLTPPVFFFVHDGPDFGQDRDYQRELELTSHWKVEDSESGIEECFWAIGSSPGDVSIQEFTKVDVNSNNASITFNKPPKSKVFVSVKCTNGAGLTNTGYSDGIRIFQEPPNTDDVIFELMTLSETQFHPQGAYHGNRSEIKFRWTGFDVNDGLGSYMIGLDGKGIAITEIVQGSTFGFTYASFTGLHLNDGKYTVTLTGINEVKMFSKRVSAEFFLLTSKPKLSGTAILTSYYKNTGKATASWKDVFISDHPLYYEVTARLVEGGEGDIVQWQETTNTHIDIDMADFVRSEGGATVLFSVRAVNYAGLFETHYGDLFVAN